MIRTLQRGLQTGLKTTWDLGKIIFPISLIVTILGFTPFIGWLSTHLSPYMGYIGLSGEAAIPLLLGTLLNLYAPIGAMLTMELTVKEVFILAVMLSIAHNLIVETAVTRQVGAPIWMTVTIRIGLALMMAALINAVWDGGGEKAVYGFIAEDKPEQVEHWGMILWIGLKSAVMGVLKLAVIVIPVMLFIQIMKDLHWLDRVSKVLHPLTKLIGVEKNSSITLASGFFFGLAYGAGVMIQAVKEDGVSKKDLYLVIIFLSVCHAVIEDTIVFLPLGIPVWPMILIRFVLAVILTVTVSRIWNARESRSKYASSQPVQADS